RAAKRLDDDVWTNSVPTLVNRRFRFRVILTKIGFKHFWGQFAFGFQLFEFFCNRFLLIQTGQLRFWLFCNLLRHQLQLFFEIVHHSLPTWFLLAGSVTNSRQGF
ncbi:hypothetical protein VC116059_000949B, partial [Vibrio cholerae O1 str. 116059]